MNLKELKELIEMLKNTDISEVEIERSGVKVRLRKGGDVTFHPAMPRMEYPPAAIVAPAISEDGKAGCRAARCGRISGSDQGHVTDRRHLLPGQFA